MWMPGLIFGWLALILVALIYLYLHKCCRDESKSDRYALAVWLIANTAMKLMAPIVFGLCSSFVQYSHVIWYTSWAAIDFIAVASIYYVHQKKRLEPSKIASFVSMSFVVLAVVQMAGYVDRAILETKAIDEAYRYLILSINFAVAPMSVFYIVKSGPFVFKGIKR